MKIIEFGEEKISKHNYKFLTSHSDTETLFAGLNTYGINFINEIEGQFSFFYIDKKKKKIYFARDRVGQKPLYINTTKDNILFLSLPSFNAFIYGKSKWIPPSI